MEDVSVRLLALRPVRDNGKETQEVYERERGER